MDVFKRFVVMIISTRFLAGIARDLVLIFYVGEKHIEKRRRLFVLGKLMRKNRNGNKIVISN